MGILNSKTKLVNQTGHPIDFKVDGKEFQVLPGLKAGATETVKMKSILDEGSRHDPLPWRVSVQSQHHTKPTLELHPSDHVMTMTVVVFRLEPNSDGVIELAPQGVKENCPSRISGRYIKL